MPKQLLFYDSAIPVSSARHRDLRIANANYDFAARVNSVPLTAVEIPLAARDYAIVFAGDEALAPVVLLGIENDRNVYMSADGTWNADYVPAFVRRYPFVFSENDDKTRFTLCVDESWSACQREGEGRRLFDDNGEQTDYLKQMLKFLEEYQTHFNRTRVFCSRLKELDVLEPMKADFTLANGTKHSLSGFMVVSRDKLKAVDPDVLMQMLKSDELELVFDHLLSMNNLKKVADRASKHAAGVVADAEAEAVKQ